MSDGKPETTAYECADCIGMIEHGCYCRAMGATQPGGPRAVTVTCEACGGEGRIWKARYGGNDPDLWDAGPCPACDGTCYVDVESEPATQEDVSTNAPP